MSVYIKKADKLSIQMDTNQDKILIDISSVSLIYVSESMIVRMSIKLNSGENISQPVTEYFEIK